MKKISVIILFLLIGSLCFSQSPVEEVEIFQNLFGMKKKDAVSKLIKLDGTKNESFWKLYDKYEMERKSFGKDRILLVNDYANNYLQMTDDKIDELFKRSVTVTGNLDKLAVKYYKKIKKEVDTKTAAQFYQIEMYFLAAIRYELTSNIPFIGELESK
ncbi:MAG: hypothetical protein AAF600_03195 [Bacteroidota bacterium]